MEFLFVHKLIIFLIDVVAATLGGMIYLNNPKGKMNKIFILMVISMLVWVNFAFFARLFQNSIFLKADSMSINKEATRASFASVMMPQELFQMAARHSVIEHHIFL